MRTFIKLALCLLIFSTFTACCPIFMVHRQGTERGWYWNNHRYQTRREYRDARKADRGHDKRNYNYDSDSRGDSDSGYQRRGR